MAATVGEWRTREENSQRCSMVWSGTRGLHWKRLSHPLTRCLLRSGGTAARWCAAGRWQASPTVSVRRLVCGRCAAPASVEMG